MTTPYEVVWRVRAALEPLADEALARQMFDYQRGQFPFLGIPAPQRREAVGRPADTLDGPGTLEAAALLWELPQREFKYSAIDLLVRNVRRLDPSALEPLRSLALREPWWDTVDALAGVIGTIVRHHRATDPAALAAMDAALIHPSLWARRIAMLHQRGWRLETDEERLFRYALALAAETDFFIRKAVGWALRDYRRWSPATVDSFLATHRARFAPLTLREAERHGSA